jgi:hypothetical protein
VEARTGEDISAIKVYAHIGELHCIDLVFQSPSFASMHDEDGFNSAFVAAESLLGEEILDKWIGLIELTTSAEGKRFLPLERLKETVDALIASIIDQMPDRPCHEFPVEPGGAVFKREVEEMDDYPRKLDLLIATTMFPELWKSAHNDRSFYSQRFSRCGERFCYLKIDGRDGLDSDKFADRGDIEDALENALKEARVGCVIGGGTGLRYAYIDLALTDVLQASDIIRRVLRAGNIPRRSWLLFFDCEWEREWIGIWEDTPAPPV